MDILIIHVHKSVSKNFFPDKNNLPLPTEQISNQEQQNQCSRALCCWCLEQRFAPENSCSYMYVIKPKNKMITNRCMCLQLNLQDLTINSTQNNTCYNYRSIKTLIDVRCMRCWCNPFLSSSQASSCVKSGASTCSMASVANSSPSNFASAINWCFGRFGNFRPASN